MSSAAARLFGLELAGLQGATDQTIDQLAQQRQEAPAQDSQEGLAVYESTLVGLAGLQHLYGEASDEVAAAESAVVTMLGEVFLQLQEAYNKDILFSVRKLLAGPGGPLCSCDVFMMAVLSLDVSRRMLG